MSNSYEEGYEAGIDRVFKIIENELNNYDACMKNTGSRGKRGVILFKKDALLDFKSCLEAHTGRGEGGEELPISIDLYVYEKILNYFNGDHDKTKIWFKTPNPGLGNICPLVMIGLGRTEKLVKFIDDRLNGITP